MEYQIIYGGFMNRQEQRNLAVEVVDSALGELSRSIKRVGALFSSPADALEKIIIPELEGTFGKEFTHYSGAAVPQGPYTGEVRNLTELMGTVGGTWVGTVHKIAEIVGEGRAAGFFKQGDYFDMPVKVDAVEVEGVQFPAVDGVARVVVTYSYIKGVVFNYEQSLFRAQMNEDSTNKGGFKESALAKYLNGAFWRSALSEIGDCMMENVDGFKVAVPTLYEVFGNDEYGKKSVNWGEAIRHYYFLKCTNRIKVQLEDEDDTVWWWTSTPRFASAANFCAVSNSGGVGSNNASFSYGVAPCFCIKERE